MSTENLPGPISPRDLRVSDAEREHVVGVLQKAIGHGMLSLDEFTVRTDIALAAKTRAELNTVLVDLPGVINREPGSPTAVPPMEFRAVMSSLKREGPWIVPREMTVHNRMGSSEFDFTEAEIGHREVQVKLDVAGGSVELLVPENASCDTDGVTAVAGSVENKVGKGGSGVRFVVTGSVRAGSVTIRRPSYVRIGSLTVRRPWKLSWDT
ncbi:DUF1707 domain-containing protein [Actinokineospora sp. NBRC 105648]|uniref:DUF1707 SHOCT-like domain-containing protein n=1 Tax=Actinokineospora sp. NBRC 105648 TaxID=3032206 RepID=UPI0024A31BC0|nr:DUF1707 domain-containing protein [Actinokineospora sp. NBRC 105648]GLZ37423.1 hypothetical protein Acsp05_10480 [Actinokineospora sp. NBRC 105648]